jgi:hypothetical protein
VIGELYFGKQFGFIGLDYGTYIESLDILFPIITLCCVAPSYLRSLFLVFTTLNPAVRKAARGYGKIVLALKNRVAERQCQLDQGKSNLKGILAMLFDIRNNKGDEEDFQIPEIEQEAWLAMYVDPFCSKQCGPQRLTTPQCSFAGSETTAIAMKSILYHLMRTPSVHNRLLEELDGALEDGSLSNPVRFSEAARLPYLTAVCKEAMRIHPSIGMSMPRHVPEGGREIAGYFFPAGTKVGISPAVMHFDEAIFGKDAKDFVPERWLKKDASNMDRYMLHFGQGARTCIGKNVSLLCLLKEFAA